MLPDDEPSGSSTLARNDDSFEEIDVEKIDEENEVKIVKVVDYVEEVPEETSREVSVLLVQQPSNRQHLLKLTVHVEDSLDGIINEVTSLLPNHDIDIKLDIYVPDPEYNLDYFIEAYYPMCNPEGGSVLDVDCGNEMQSNQIFIEDQFEEVEVDICYENEVQLDKIIEDPEQVKELEQVGVEDTKTECDVDVDIDIEEPSTQTVCSKPSTESVYSEISETPEVESLTPEKCREEDRMTIELPDSPILSGKRKCKSRRRKTSSSNKIDILTIYPPPPDKGGISVNSEDFKCLATDEFLNDVIIDFYIKYLLHEVLSPSDRQRTHVFSSHFFTRLANPLNGFNSVDSQNGNNDNDDEDDDLAASRAAARLRHAGVERWTKNVNIFEKDFVIVPINQNAHWFLAIICFPNLVGFVSRRHSDCITVGDEHRKPCILILDSLTGCSKPKIAAMLREYLYWEYIAKMHDDMEFSYGAIQTVYPKVPKQTNATDCGLYVLQYIESFFENPIRDYTLPIKDLSNWFREAVIARKRAKIATIITELAINSGKGEEVKAMPLQLSPNLVPVQSKTISSDEETDPSLSNLNYKLKRTAEVCSRPVRATRVQNRSTAMINLAKSFLKRKKKNDWVSKEVKNSDYIRTSKKSIFTESPKKCFSNESNASQFVADVLSDDKFYNLSFDALNRETGISPRMSFSGFKIKKLAETQGTSNGDF